MNIHDKFIQIFKKQKAILRFRSIKIYEKILRHIKSENIDDVKLEKIPAIINNRNRLTYMVNLINWLENAGIKNIIILDNKSTYPPLLEYYKTTKHRVIFLNENVGHLALWKTPLYKEIRSNFYLYTDPDILPCEDCPIELVNFMLDCLKKYRSIQKIGVGLKIDDIPDHYTNKNKVIDWEKKFWSNRVDENIYDAPVDTTFALYRPYTNFSEWDVKSYRTGGPYLARHMPWYENSQQPDPESIYYAENLKKGVSFWINNK
jgi:hypothetical protein